MFYRCIIGIRIEVILSKMYVLVLVLIFQSSSALAYCSEPSHYTSEPSFSGSEPDAPASYTKPSVPYCLGEYSYTGKHTCEEYELDSYFSEVDRYLSELNSYIEDAVNYSNEARRFANEVIDFSNSIRQFAEDVVEYADCEARDVKSQHE